jgi:carboxylesterase
LAKTRYEDWFALAEQTFLELVKQCGGVILGGQSMGALLALDIASRYAGETRGVVAYANAITLGSPFPAWPLRWLSHVNTHDSRLERVMLPKLSGPNLADEVARRTHLTYSAQPILAAASLQRAGDRVRTQLAAIQCPVFLAHGALDATTPLENAFSVAQALQVHDVEVHIFPRSAHILSKDLDHAQLAQRSTAFIRRLVS